MKNKKKKEKQKQQREVRDEIQLPLDEEEDDMISIGFKRSGNLGVWIDTHLKLIQRSLLTRGIRRDNKISMISFGNNVQKKFINFDTLGV